MQNMRQPIYPSNPADLELYESAREVLHVRGRSDKNSVGAAVRTDKGIFIGLDLKSRKSAICAEPGAISAAYSAGGYLLDSVVAVCMRGDEDIVAISPCGACRELLNFHAPDCRVLFQYEDSWVELKAKELFRYPIIFGLTMECWPPQPALRAIELTEDGARDHLLGATFPATQAASGFWTLCARR